MKQFTHETPGKKNNIKKCTQSFIAVTFTITVITSVCLINLIENRDKSVKQERIKLY